MTVWEMVSGKEALSWGGILTVVVLSLLEVSKININPWSALFRTVGRAMNREVLAEVKELKKQIEEHIRVDDERDADGHRSQILHFNVELIQEVPHTREDFIEILSVIDSYESYCRSHKEYKNNRAGCAIENIKRCYNDRLAKHDFL